jgi:hypothetical protein
MPHITPTQQKILLFIYRFRFINRIQIQTLLNNTDLKNINTWLKDLHDKQYINRIINTTETVNTTPYIYYIAINGIRYLKTQEICKREYIIRLYRERDKKEPFINRCLLIVDIYIQLLTKYKDSFTFYTHSDFTPNGLIRDILPDFAYKKQGENQYIIGELFKENMPKRYAIQPRIKNYLTFFTSPEWLKKEDPPKLLFICPNEKLEKYICWYVKKILIEDDIETLPIRVTTLQLLKENGIEGNIWKKIKNDD